MRAVLRKEIKQYFSSPIGYVYLGVFYLLCGFNFFSSVLLQNSTDMSYVFSGMFNICLFLIPILTMRLLSEEKRNRTDQALLTAPISVSKIVIGKYLAALLIYLLGLVQIFVFAIVVDCFSKVEWETILANFIGIVLLSAALIAIGTFFSAMTESQLIAAITGICVGMMLMLVERIASALPAGSIRSIVIGLSFNNHYRGFAQGRVSFADSIFFTGVCVIFLFLTIQRVEGGKR